MIFGTKPVYKYATYNKRKMHSMGRAYPFDEAPVEIKECPVKIINDRAEIFFNNPIFNTYVISIEEKVTVLKSFDEKLTFIKERLKSNILYTVKIISEDEKTREVEVFKFDEFFPGYKTKGRISIANNKPIFTCKFGSGPITLQSNEVSKEVEGMLAHLDSDGPMFVEINNPIERAIVTIIKDLNNMKIVENQNIKGILIGCKDKKVGQEVNAYVKNIYPGSYCFVEDLSPGYAEVQLIGKQGNVYQVRCRDFVGECKDKKVSKVMKGIISNIKGNTFQFKQGSPEMNERTKDFETVKIAKKVKISSEKDIKEDERSAIEFINQQIEAKVDVKPLFAKYMNIIKDHDSLSIFYLKYLSDIEDLSQKQVDKIVEESSKKFPSLATSLLEDEKLIKMIFKKTKTLSGFKKLLPSEEDKVKFIKENLEYFDYSISYIYENMNSPRVVVESVIDNNYKNWIFYVKQEDGNYKRNLFRRMVKMNFKKNAMLEIFKLWLEFEESVSGNVEEVHIAQQEYTKNK